MQAKSMEQLIAEVREKGRQREALADALLGGISDGDSLSFYRKDGHTALVGPDVSKAGGFRLTRFDSRGPIGLVAETLSKLPVEAGGVAGPVGQFVRLCGCIAFRIPESIDGGIWTIFSAGA